jgi:transcriptional regulator with XRE-family HTH domain
MLKKERNYYDVSSNHLSKRSRALNPPKFVERDYRERLALLREAVSGENQLLFAERIGIPAKTWNHYERGNAMPRDAAFKLCEEFNGLTLDWIFYGRVEGLSKEFSERLSKALRLRETAKQLEREFEETTARALEQLEKGKTKLTTEKRALHAPRVRRRRQSEN